MIYILNENVLNGTVTMDVMNTGIEAESFDEAINKLKAKFTNDVKINTDNNTVFSYYVAQKDGSPFAVHGVLRNKPLKIII